MKSLLNFFQLSLITSAALMGAGFFMLSYSWVPAALGMAGMTLSFIGGAIVHDKIYGEWNN